MIEQSKVSILTHRIRGLFRIAGIGFVAVFIGSMSACGSTESAAALHVQGRKISQVVRGYEVLLVPNLQAGVAGWCLTVVRERVRECGAPSTWRGGIFTESCASHTAPGIEVYALTSPNVKTVSVDGGPQIATRATPALVDGLRSVFVEIHRRANEVGSNGEPCPRVIPLNGRGKPIVQRRIPGLPLEAVLPELTKWQLPASPSDGPCILRAANLPGYVARWGDVAKKISASRVFDGGFLSCVDTEYFSPEDTSMDAAVLLDAAHPGVAPMLLPGMKALQGHPGVFEAPGSEGELVARRIPRAWLVVEEGGTGLQEPLTLLEHLQAAVDNI